MKTPAKMTEDPSAYWNQEAGPKWVENQEALDRILDPISAVLLGEAKAEEAEFTIDIGCGCGGTTLALAASVGPKGRVVGVDISTPMLRRARERCAHLPQVRLEDADATHYAFEARAADLVISRFGIMFFVDQAAAFRNILTSLKPGGRLCASVWRAKERNPWILGPLQALPAMPKPEPMPEEAPGPFRLADAEETQRLLVSVGFCDVALRAFDTKLPVGDTPEQAMQFYSRVGPLSMYLGTLGETDRSEAEQQVLDYLSAHWGTDAIPTAASCWIVEAKAPLARTPGSAVSTPQ